MSVSIPKDGWKNVAKPRDGGTASPPGLAKKPRGGKSAPQAKAPTAPKAKPVVEFDPKPKRPDAITKKWLAGLDDEEPVVDKPRKAKVDLDASSDDEDVQITSSLGNLLGKLGQKAKDNSARAAPVMVKPLAAPGQKFRRAFHPKDPTDSPDEDEEKHVPQRTSPKRMKSEPALEKISPKRQKVTETVGKSAAPPLVMDSQEDPKDPYSFPASEDEPKPVPLTKLMDSRILPRPPAAASKPKSRNSTTVYVLDSDKEPSLSPPGRQLPRGGKKQSSDAIVLGDSSPDIEASKQSSKRRSRSRSRGAYGDAVLAFYEKDSLYYPARLVNQSLKPNKELSTVEYVNGETARLPRNKWAFPHDPQFNEFQLGRLPMAKPGDMRTLEQRRQSIRAQTVRAAIPDIPGKLADISEYLLNIFGGSYPDLWRYKDLQKGTSLASRRLLEGAIQAYFAEDEYRTIGDFALDLMGSVGRRDVSDADKRKISLDVLAPEAAIRLIMEHHGVDYEAAETLFHSGGDRPRGGGKLQGVAEEWVQTLLAWRSDMAFGSVQAPK